MHLFVKRMSFCLFLFYFLLQPVSVVRAADDKTDCFSLLENRCQQCHYLERVCKNVGEKNKRRWKATLERMVERRGAGLTGNEQDFLLQCLAAPDPGIVKGCKK